MYKLLQGYFYLIRVLRKFPKQKGGMIGMRNYKKICEDCKVFKDIPDPENLEEFKILEERFEKEFGSEIKESVVNESKEDDEAFMNKLDSMTLDQLQEMAEDTLTPYIRAVARLNGLEMILGVDRYE